MDLSYFERKFKNFVYVHMEASISRPLAKVTFLQIQI